MWAQENGFVRQIARHRRALAPVLLLLVLTLGSFVFLAIADEVAEGEIKALDEQVLLALRNPLDASDPLGPPWLEEAALEITAIGGYPVIVLSLLMVTGLLVVTRRYGAAFYAVLSVGSGALVSYILKNHYERPRPDIVEHLDVIHTASFPSGHATVTTVAYLTLAALVVRFFPDWRIRLYVLAVAVFISFTVGVSRIYLGVHWPSDVAAGWALGAAWASFTWLCLSLHALYRGRRLADGAGKRLRESSVEAMEKP
ncbi:PA-phosphatase-like phosphoesterase [Nitratireductor aquibiodomus RA22]|uniref:PA-phosphatase-like phosphoesterase n=1 Tax=Nitratireductor aquibiodomus RA22 TaxID=1189611 RepID=I5BXY0_9HYPH|nr:phosphatase PAP2 family protein [Nitratireductor aquibiodomus]EIM74432.1 PA-phosphatase-like phosphoesterase [Nitratireductor aquibiodomus RA22]